MLVAAGAQAGGRKSNGAISCCEYPGFAKHIMGEASARGYVPEMAIATLTAMAVWT